MTTLELDIQITKDGQAVVTHDRKNTPGSRIPLLSEVFALVRRYHADDVMLNVETKVEAGAPQETALREQFVQVAAREIREAGFLDQVMIQSFDWGALMRMREVEPRLPIVALTNFDFLQTGLPGASPWLGGIDIDDFGGDPIAAIRSFGADAFSQVHGFPQGGRFGDPGYRPYVTSEMVAHAHRYGIKVIPWTVDDPATLNKLIDDGVDGIITDYPNRLRQIAADRGFRLPRATPPRSTSRATAAPARCARRTRSPRSTTRCTSPGSPRWSWTPG